MTGRSLAALVACLGLMTTTQVAFAQVVSNPNQIRWTATCTSPEREVQDYLDASATTYWSVSATSVGTSPTLSHRSTGTSPTRATETNEITVQAGDPGAPHDVRLSRNTGIETYMFATVRSGPVAIEPAPDVEVSISECVAFIDVTWTTPRGSPVDITGASVSAYRSNDNHYFGTSVGSGSRSARLLVRADGARYTVTVSVTTGTDPYSDLLRYSASASGEVRCGDSIALVHRLPADGEPGNVIVAPSDPDWVSGSGGGSGGAVGLGRIIGQFDLVGLEETYAGSVFTSLRAHGGPWSNERYDALRRSPSSGAYELENLIPSESVAPLDLYRVVGSASVGSSGVTTPGPEYAVPSGATLDLADLFVVEPATMTGDVLLVAPVAPDRGDSLLADLGTSTTVSFSSRGATWPDGSVISGSAPASTTRFGAIRSTDGTEITGSFEVPLALIAGGSATWRAPRLRLVFGDSSTEPIRHHVADLSVRDNSSDYVLRERESADHDVAYCFGELRVRFVSTAGTFRSPRLSGGGGYVGLDFLGRDANYAATDVHAYGTPTSSQTPTAEGLVLALLPEGQYTFGPEVTAVNPGGGTSEVQLPTLRVGVGCQQVVEVMTDFVLAVRTVGSCSDSGSVRLAGAVTGPADVARIVASAEGGPVVVACEPCGVAPTFEIDVPVPTGLATITVTAEGTGGERASVLTRVSTAPPPSDLPSLTQRLHVRKAGADLRLSWDATGVEAEVHAGTIDSLWSRRRYDHGAVGACAVTGGTVDLPRPAHDAYYLVRGTCGSQSRSLGRDSFGWQRPPPAPACW